MTTIHKFEVSPLGNFVCCLPQGAKFCHVAEQRKEEINMWFEVDTDNPRVERHFAVYGTGQPIHESNVKYLGSFILMNGELVFHLHELL